MINVPNEFHKQMEYDRSFQYSAQMTLLNGTVINLTEDDFAVGACGITCSAGSQSLPLGNAICRKLDLSIFNTNDRYERVSFFGAEIIPKLEYQLSQTRQPIILGTFTVTEPETYGSMVTLTAYDDFYKADREYVASGSFPMTAGSLLRLCCTACGLSLQTSTFTNDDYVIQKAPDGGVTYRQVIGLIAMLAGGNAVIKAGSVWIVPYDVGYLDTHAGYDGGIFDGSTPYSTGDDLSGGTFNPWNTGDVFSDAFTDWNGIHYFYETSNPTIATDDVVITGIDVTGEENTESSGTEGYVLSLSNVLTSGNEADAAQRIGALMIGMRFRPFNVDLISYPLAELGDLCYVRDMRGTYHLSVITDIDFTFGGYTRIKCSADDPVRNSSSYYASSTEVRTRQISRQIAQSVTSAYDREVQRMVKLMANSMGMHETVQTLADGSHITIMHDGPTIAQSTKLWKQTADAFMVSSDGGQTWNAGFDVYGNSVLNVLSAVGINFDWAHGGTLTLGGNNNINGQLRVLDANGNQIGSWNYEGLKATGELEMTYYAEGFTANEQDATLKMGFGQYEIMIEDYGGGFTVSEDMAGICLSKVGENTYNKLYLCNYDFPLQSESSTSGTNYILSKCGLYIRADATGYNMNPSPYSMSLPGNGIGLYGTRGKVVLDYSHLTFEHSNGVVCTGNLSVNGNLSVTGTKPRLVTTEDYAKRYLYCYETPSPLFGDVGEGTIADDGKCYVYLDAVFAETINTNQYQVFIQKYGSGDCWVSERHPGYFVVEGTPGLSFGWELKAKQLDFDQKRLDMDIGPVEEDEKTNYGLQASLHLSDLRKEREETEE